MRISTLLTTVSMLILTGALALPHDSGKRQISMYGTCTSFELCEHEFPKKSCWNESCDQSNLGGLCSCNHVVQDRLPNPGT
ncbi:hypothetical protein PZA11_001718 [Diplocarpon coronariae]